VDGRQAPHTVTHQRDFQAEIPAKTEQACFGMDFDRLQARYQQLKAYRTGLADKAWRAGKLLAGVAGLLFSGPFPGLLLCTRPWIGPEKPGTVPYSTVASGTAAVV
jgi:ribosome modulation factor